MEEEKSPVRLERLTGHDVRVPDRQHCLSWVDGEWSPKLSASRHLSTFTFRRKPDPSCPLRKDVVNLLKSVFAVFKQERPEERVYVLYSPFPGNFPVLLLDHDSAVPLGNLRLPWCADRLTGSATYWNQGHPIRICVAVTGLQMLSVARAFWSTAPVIGPKDVTPREPPVKRFVEHPLFDARLLDFVAELAGRFEWVYYGSDWAVHPRK